jgi:hypothetical protein
MVPRFVQPGDVSVKNESHEFKPPNSERAGRNFKKKRFYLDDKLSARGSLQSKKPETETRWFLVTDPSIKHGAIENVCIDLDSFSSLSMIGYENEAPDASRK